ncbi:hypothetical protein C0992_004725 [Termitomyces sp. T32_za158]|nr:hypothetical protein C0992_004725 [Termitomyces sp. T32_za158]
MINSCVFPSLSLSLEPSPLMVRKQVPDLGSLESPLISANPFGSILGIVPDSALAERIFNDPDSWQGADDDDDDDDVFKDTDSVKWLADEVRIYQAIGEELKLSPISPIDRDVDIMLKPLSTETFNLDCPTATEKPTNWDNIVQENRLPSPSLFDHTSLDLNLHIDLRLSKLWDAKGKGFQSLQSPASRINEPKILHSIADARLAVPPALNLGQADNTLSPSMSPFNVASASTTWSILELYGVHPNTPRVHGRVPLLTHYPPTPYHTKSSTLSSLREFISLSANTTVPTKTSPSVPESTPIRRLPVVPDTSDSTSPTPLRATTPSRSSTLTSQRTKSPEQCPQYIKTHLRSTSGTTPSGSTLRSRRRPRGSATLPPLNSPDSSPSPTPIRTGNLSTRSSPAGPRPRSSTNSIRQRQASGRGSPSPIVIEPVPAFTHARQSSSPPGR